MKRIFTALIILTLINICEPANAGYFADKKAEALKAYELKSAKEAVIRVIKKQNKYASKYDYTGLFNLYSNDFKSADGFDKKTYFTLIKDTWKSYPDIVYSITNIEKIEVNNDRASVDIFETSLATATQIEDGLKIFGELNSESYSTYFLKKIDNKWLICGEKVKSEKSYLKYGDARFVNMDLVSPETVKPDEYYTSTLKIEAPEDSFFVASIARDEITYPHNKTEEVFRKLPDDNILERMFYANKNGKNEYNIATVGMTKSKIYDIDKIKVYMAGLAFIMTRVNVEEENAEKNQ